MTGIVFGKTYQAACNELKEIDENYELSNIHSIRKIISKNDAYIVYENGDIWRAKTPNQVRGFRANIAYIDSRISYDMIRTRILPMLVLRPYTGFQYFTPNESEDING